MKKIKFFALACALILQNSFIYADDEVEAYNDKVIEFFKGQNDLSMVLGAGGDGGAENYTRLEDYTFLVNNDKEKSLKAFNEYRKSEIKSLLDINLSETPIPLILDFVDTPVDSVILSGMAKNKNVLNYEKQYASPLSKFLKNFHNQFSEIIFDHSVTKFLGNNATLFWLQSICKALNDDGVFILDDLNSGISLGIYNADRFEKLSLSLPNDLLKLQTPDSYGVMIKSMKYGSKTYELPAQSDIPEASWEWEHSFNDDGTFINAVITSKQLNEFNQKLLSRNNEAIEFNKRLLQKAGFGLVEIHRDEPYPILYHENKASILTFYKAYKTDPAKKDPVKKLITSLEILKTSLDQLVLKLKPTV